MKRYFNTKEAAERHLERRRNAAIKRIQKRDDVILQDFSKVYQDFKWRLTKGDIIGDTGLEMWTSTQTNELKWFTQLEILTKQMKEDLDKLPNFENIQKEESKLIKEMEEKIEKNIRKNQALAPYAKKETFPEHIKYIKDTDNNRGVLTLKLGNPKFVQNWEHSYIEINTKEKTWRTCNSFEWLYRNQPPLMNINHLIKLL